MAEMHGERGAEAGRGREGVQAQRSCTENTQSFEEDFILRVEMFLCMFVCVCVSACVRVCIYVGEFGV